MPAAHPGFRPRRDHLQLARNGLILVLAQPRLNAGMTSLANHLSCSLNSWGGNPSAQWIIKSSRPGYFASIDLIPSITCDGGPQNQAFCCTPSASEGTRAGAPGVPQVRPSSSA